jgi:hypothetical protein
MIKDVGKIENDEDYAMAIREARELLNLAATRHLADQQESITRMAQAWIALAREIREAKS